MTPSRMTQFDTLCWEKRKKPSVKRRCRWIPLSITLKPWKLHVVINRKLQKVDLHQAAKDPAATKGGWWRDSNQPGRLAKFQVWGDVDLENGSKLYLMGQSEGERRGWIIGIVGKMLGDARASDEKDVPKIASRICGTATASCGRRWGHRELETASDGFRYKHATLIQATCDSDPVETVVLCCFRASSRMIPHLRIQAKQREEEDVRMERGYAALQRVQQRALQATIWVC